MFSLRFLAQRLETVRLLLVSETFFIRVYIYFHVWVYMFCPFLKFPFLNFCNLFAFREANIFYAVTKIWWSALKTANGCNIIRRYFVESAKTKSLQFRERKSGRRFFIRSAKYLFDHHWRHSREFQKQALELDRLGFAWNNK